LKAGKRTKAYKIKVPGRSREAGRMEYPAGAERPAGWNARQEQRGWQDGMPGRSREAGRMECPAGAERLAGWNVRQQQGGYRMEFRLHSESAVIFGGKLYSSKKLNEMLRIAVNFMQRNSVPADKTIAIVLNRSPFLLIAMLAALEYGVPFLPIDIASPLDRIKAVLSDAGVETIITSYEHKDKFVAERLLLAEDAGTDTKLDDSGRRKENEIAYVLYTSGSTGAPKGIEITREGLANAFEGFAQVIDFSQGKRIACFTTVSFDIFFLETIMALNYGLTVVLADEAERKNPKLMANLISDKKVEMLQMTPSRLQLLLNHDTELSCLKDVKEIMIGGEPFPPALLKILQAKTIAKIYNMYGPTETTIWSSISDVTNKTAVDVGKPIKETQIYILDKERRLLPQGATGEIAIAGKGLARGYVNNETLTKERFIPLPEFPETRAYLTGDLGRYLPDGNLECLGRMDNQVKIRGYRVELEEIENVMLQYPQMTKAAVLLIEHDENKFLIAFYLAGEEIQEEVMKTFLNQKLPEYMIPIAYYRLTEFPYTNNDKIDRKQLLHIYYKLGDAAGQKQPQENKPYGSPDLASKVLNIISGRLDERFRAKVAADSLLSDLSIDSITFIKIVVALEAEFNFEFDDEMLIFSAFPTAQTMIDYVKTKADMI
jgi:acyl carrier protein